MQLGRMDRTCATVVDVRGETALVAVRPAAACAGCAARAGCVDPVAGVEGMRMVEADNPVGAGEGDVVALDISPQGLAAAAALLYGFPAATALAGAAIGTTVLAPLSGLDRDLAAGLALVLCLLLALLAVRRWGRRLARRRSFRVSIVAVVGVGSDEGGPG